MLTMREFRKPDSSFILALETSVGGLNRRQIIDLIKEKDRFPVILIFKNKIIGWAVYKLGQEDVWILRITIDQTFPYQFDAIDFLLHRLTKRLSCSRRVRVTWFVPEDQVNLLCHLRDTEYDCGTFRVVKHHRGLFCGGELDGYEMVCGQLEIAESCES